MNQELVRRMLHTSEDLAMEERVMVVDDYCQKLTDSGYLADQMRKVITRGLTGYERRRNLSMLEPTDRKYRPLHESRHHNAKGRRIAKMMSKQNWFKGKPEDSPGSPSKKMRGVEMDGSIPKRLDMEEETDSDEDMTQGQGEVATKIHLCRTTTKSFKKIQKDNKKLNKNKTKTKH